MSCTISVVLSRQFSNGSHSAEASIQLGMEVDQTSLNQPEVLQQQMEQLQRQAEVALASQVGESQSPPT